MEKELKKLLERGVDALERLAQDPIVEIEAAPAVCPHCDSLNPTVTVENGADGPLMECVLVARCHTCSRTFFAVPIAWHMHTDVKAMNAEIRERREHLNGKH